MKKLLLSVFTSLLLAACTIAAPATSESQPARPAATEALPSTPLPAVSPEPTATSAPPTAVPLTATIVSPAMAPDNLTRLQPMNSFGQGELLRSLAISPNNQLVASAGGNTEDFDIRVWNIEDGTLVFTLSGHTGIVWRVAFSPDGKWLVSTSSDETVKIWDAVSGTLETSIDMPGEILSASFSPDGSTLAVGGSNGFPDASIWTFTVPGWVPQLKLDEFWNIPEIAFSPDGATIVGGGTSRNARMWKAADGTEIAILSHSGQVSSLAISPDGTTIAAGLCADAGDSGICTQDELWLWNLATARVRKIISIQPDWITKVEYTPDGSLLLVSTREGKLLYFSTPDYELTTFSNTPGSYGVFALSSDGRLLATAGPDGSVYIWTIFP